MLGTARGPLVQSRSIYQGREPIICGFSGDSSSLQLRAGSCRQRTGLCWSLRLQFRMADREYRASQLAPCLPDRQGVNLGWQREKYARGYGWHLGKQKWTVNVQKQVDPWELDTRFLRRSGMVSPATVTCVSGSIAACHRPGDCRAKAYMEVPSRRSTPPARQPSTSTTSSSQMDQGHPHDIRAQCQPLQKFMTCQTALSIILQSARQPLCPAGSALRQDARFCHA